MRLTDRERWRYRAEVISPAGLAAVIARDEWIRVARSLVPDGPLDLLELGAAPGTYSAALCHGRAWKPSGIEFSEDADTYLSTMAAFGKSAELHRIDFLTETLDRTFDIVLSVGLIEHFRGRTFDEVIALHDRYLKPGGYLVINVPNFTGFQYLWHYIFDRPDLANHNVDAMRLDSFRFFMAQGYTTLFIGHVGVMRLWGNTGFTGTWFGGKAAAGLGRGASAMARWLGRIGLVLSGPAFAPHILYVARKPPAARAAP